MQAKTKNRITIILTVLLFTLPVVAAYVLSSGLIDFKPDSTKNNGRFISPLVKVSDHTQHPWADDLMGTWTLVRRVPGSCDESCLELENDLHKYRLSLGHRAEKLALLLLADDFVATADDPFEHVQKIATAKQTKLNQMFDQLSAKSLQNGHGLYVVAPEGYLMMAFTPENTSTEIIRDLSLLVKRKGE